MIRILALVAAVALTGYALHLLAQPRIDTRTAVTPIASSSSNGVSFAWFYDPADGAPWETGKVPDYMSMQDAFGTERPFKKQQHKPQRLEEPRTGWTLNRSRMAVRKPPSLLALTMAARPGVGLIFFA